MGVRWLILVLIVVCSGQWWFRCCYHHSSVGIKCFENGISDDQSSASLYFWCSGVIVSRFIVVFFFFFCFLCSFSFFFFPRSFSSLYTNHHTCLQLFQLSYASVYVQMFRKSSVVSSFSSSSFLFFFFIFSPLFVLIFVTLITTHFSRCFYYPIRQFTSKCFEKKKLPLESAGRAPELQAGCQQALRFCVCAGFVLLFF